MPPRLTTAWKKISSAAAGFSFAQKTVSILAVLVLALGVTGLSLWMSQPQRVPLYTGLSAADAEAITQQLKTDNVSYQLTDGGSSILVPQESVYTERLKSAAAGLPTAANKGYSLLDNMSITTSEFQQSVTYQRAMEGELANTIEAMDGVKSSSVKLAIPEKTVFTDQAADPTASVFIATASGHTLTRGQVQAIVHLTSAAIVGMKPADVSVIDSSGAVLSAIGGSASVSDGTADTLQASVQSAVQGMLDKVLGSGNSTVTANASLSQATGTKTTQTYTVPTGAPVTSSSEEKETYTGSGPAAAGVLGQPSLDVATNGTRNTTRAVGGNGSYQSAKLVKDNALNSVTETQSIPAGLLQRLTVSVVVNKTVAEAAGLATAQLSQMVSAAAGVETTRGDTVSVEFVGFSKAAQQALKQAQQDQQGQQLAEWTREGLVAVALPPR
ncbi:flagellar M-ring protein FliF [Leifsonia xyli subsp. xyli]|uniref:Flagellar M-ring protein n=2 Tax=Leifsonia xyli subsp. xyli TaxID=59736 RepID=Q6AGA8_LEIXX|nr:flagellar basal-body MS-ring/collar protein FliF [Leifsonia xyli]AAT88587.1 flagellar M-ring protein [Leifsonia xyli subsp. xyli str. CTCB07]ODA90530.1 flagellar M-ring protein FliF [Leifsonia xyli subsp. xyli]